MKYAVFTGLLALARVHAKSTSHVDDVLVEDLHRVPQGWNEVGVPAQNRKLHFRIAVHSVSAIISSAHCLHVHLVFTREHVPPAPCQIAPVSLSLG